MRFDMRIHVALLLLIATAGCTYVGDAVETSVSDEVKQELANSTATAVRASGAETITVETVSNYSSYNATVTKVNALLTVLEIPLSADFDGLPADREGYERFRNDTEAFRELIAGYNGLVRASKEYKGDPDPVLNATQQFMAETAWFTASSTYTMGEALWSSVKNES